ncbi:DUF6183 family protein [Streptomyces sp. IBSNAI002]|uniref:DUF6183 family protein n=1 Tax=Streptomyces sp. IBSNAI002 TaxID=3457500 RepID=UPI003FD0F95E
MTGDARELVWHMGEGAATRLREGDLDYVGTVGGQLWEGFRAASEQARAYGDGLSRVIRMLALTPGRPSLEQLIRLMEQHGTSVNQRMNERFIASLLAEGQRPADLVELLYAHGRRDGLDGLRSCLFHELLLRGADVSALRPTGRFGWSPLGWLPQDLRPFETGAPVPTRKADGSGCGGVWTGATGPDRLEPATPRPQTPSPLPDRATGDLHEAIVAAPHAGDFGCYGAWVFVPEHPLDPALVPAFVPTLAMPCVEGLAAEGRPGPRRRGVPVTAPWSRDAARHDERHAGCEECDEDANGIGNASAAGSDCFSGMDGNPHARRQPWPWPERFGRARAPRSPPRCSSWAAAVTHTAFPRP